MKARLTQPGMVILQGSLKMIFGNPPSMTILARYAAEVEASVDRALTPTAEIRQHTNGTCWCRYITLDERYVEWVG